MSITNTFTTGAPITAAVGPQDVEKRYAATEAQLEVWLSSMQSVEANCAYNEIASLQFSGGDVDVDRIENALAKVVQRHGSLRSQLSDDGQQVIVNRSVNYQFDTVDFRDQSEEQTQESLREVIINQASTPFDLVNGPLLRCVFQQISAGESKLTVTAHHLILDGWSLAVLCEDLGHFYAALGGKKLETLAAAGHYDQYAKAMDDYFKTDAGKADEAFWVDQFADQIPVLDLPSEKKRPPLRTYFADRLRPPLQ